MHSAVTDFGRNINSWVSIQRITPTSIQVRYGMVAHPRTIKYQLIRGTNIIDTVLLKGGNNAGQILLKGLQPETDYKIIFRTDKNFIELNATTQPAPKSKKLFSIALFADPHLSCSQENRHGRLHVESVMLLRTQLQKAVSSKSDLVIIPGDITDEGTPEQYDLVEKMIADLPIPVMATTGNHDIVKHQEAFFHKIFGESAFIRIWHDFQLIALDTADGKLNNAKNRAVIKAIDPKIPVIMFTHYQLFADDWISDADRVIADTEDCREMLLKIASCKSILYCGHKNIATSVQCGNLCQMNLPQLTQFPAGYLEATFYEEGIWHNFMPISSEVLNEYSRQISELYHIKSAYRDGKTQHEWNKVIK